MAATAGKSGEKTQYSTFLQQNSAQNQLDHKKETASKAVAEGSSTKNSSASQK
jgi:hypothetical protein